MRKTATCSPPTSTATPVSGTISSSRHTFMRRRSCRDRLPAFFDEHHAAVGLVAVHEMAEAPEDLRRLDRLLPLAGVGLDLALHVGFELGAEPERIIADHLAQVVDADMQR